MISTIVSHEHKISISGNFLGSWEKGFVQKQNQNQNVDGERWHEHADGQGRGVRGGAQRVRTRAAFGASAVCGGRQLPHADLRAGFLRAARRTRARKT